MKDWLWRLRPLLWAAIVALVTTQSIFTALAIGRSRYDYSCLTFESQGSYILDVGTGFVLPKRRVSAPRQAVYLQNSQWQLYHTSDGLLLERRADRRAYTLQIEGSVQSAIFSPDGRWLAYNWLAMPGQPLSLTLVELQSDEFGMLPLRQIQIDEVGSGFMWSPKGKLLLIKGSAEGTFKLWSATEERARTFSIADALAFNLWRPDNAEKQFAYFTYRGAGNERSNQLHIADLQNVRASYPLPAVPSQVIWAPHDRYLALWISLFPRWQIGVADTKGNWHAVALVAQRGDALSLPPIFWADDGETLFYLQDEGTSPLRWHWVAYRPAERSYRTIVQDIAKRPYFSRTNPQQAVFIWAQAGKRSATLMRLDGSQRVVMAEAADDMGDPYWSPDGQYAAIVWATGQADRRVVRLTVVNADTGAVQTLTDGLWDVRDLRWLAGSASLFFISERGAQGRPVYGAELFIPSTGEHRILLAGKDAVGMALLHGWDSVQFWWRERQTLGVSRHVADGQIVFAHSLPDEGSTPIRQVQVIDQLFIVQSPFPSAVLAPNSGALALKVGMTGDERLYIVKPDGSWSLVRQNLSGLGDPLWSPDGAYLAFTQSVNQGRATLEIVTANGALIRRVEGYRGLFGSLKWTRCGYSE